MTAPTTQTSAAERVEYFALDEVKPSPHNRRVDVSQLSELAESIARHGVITPLVGRLPDGPSGHVELIAGERRWRAAAKAGLVAVPVVVRDLSDEQALEAILEDNLNRTDIHPMDEAECFERLRDDFGYTVEQLADRFGKTTSHVYKRLRLLNLETKVRAAYVAGKLDHRAALQLARLTNHDDQVLLAKEAAEVNDDAKKPSWKRDNFDQGIRDDFMPDLAAAPFDRADADLVPMAGSCTACPNRTGQQRELFDDLKKKDDLCLDRKCYRAKVDAWWSRTVADAEVQGTKVLSDKEAKKVFSKYGSGLAYDAPYVETTETLEAFTRWDSKSRKSLKSATKKDPPQLYLVRSEKGKIFELYKQDEVTKKLKELGLINKAQASRASTGRGSYRAADAKHRRDQKVKRETGARAIAAAVAKAEGGLTSALVTPLARVMCTGHEATDTAKSRGFKRREELEAEVTKREKAGDSSWLRGLVVELALRGATWDGGVNPVLGKALKAWGIDPKKIEREVRAEMRAKAAAKKRRPPAQRGKAKKQVKR